MGGELFHASRHRRDIHVPVLSCVRVCGTTLTVHMHMLAHIYVHDLRDSANVPIPDVAVFSKVPPCALQRQEPLPLGFMYFLLLPRFLVCVTQVAVCIPSSSSEGKLRKTEASTIRLLEKPVSWCLYLVPGTWLLEAKPRLPWESRTRHQMGKKQLLTGSFKQPFP